MQPKYATKIRNQYKLKLQPKYATNATNQCANNPKYATNARRAAGKRNQCRRADFGTREIWQCHAHPLLDNLLGILSNLMFLVFWLKFRFRNF